MDSSDFLGANGVDSMNETDFRPLADFLGGNQPFERQISSAEPSTNCNAPFDMSATFAGTPDGSDSFQHVFSTLSSSSDPDLQQLMTSITEPVETGRQAPHAQPLAWCTQATQLLPATHIDGINTMPPGGGTQVNQATRQQHHQGVTHGNRGSGLSSLPESLDESYLLFNGVPHLPPAQAASVPFSCSHMSPSSLNSSDGSPCASDLTGSSHLSSAMSTEGSYQSTAEQIMGLKDQQHSLDQLQQNLATQGMTKAQLRTNKLKHFNGSPGSPESMGGTSTDSMASAMGQAARLEAICRHQQAQIMAQQRTQKKLLQLLNQQKKDDTSVSQQSVAAFSSQPQAQQSSVPLHKQQQLMEIGTRDVSGMDRQLSSALLQQQQNHQLEHCPLQQQQQQQLPQQTQRQLPLQQFERRQPEARYVQLDHSLHGVAPPENARKTSIDEPSAKKRKHAEHIERKDSARVISNDNASDSEDEAGSRDQNSTDNCRNCLNWTTHYPENFCQLIGANGEDIETPLFRVEANKGFVYSGVDDAFVCQKKNHFQVSVIISLPPGISAIKTSNGPTPLEKLTLSLHAIKMESPNSSGVVIEQSQTNRKKLPFDPVPVNPNGDFPKKITMGRLHFSETTVNNMRRKNRPNPDQRYFSLVVTLEALSRGGDVYTIDSQASDRLIVRASNPGTFDNELEAAWQKGPQQGVIYHMGKVGIGTDQPDQMLTVYGNMRVSGQVYNQSDRRLKENIEETEPEAHLSRMANLKLYNYKYKDTYAAVTGMDIGEEEVGVIAQEVQEVIPAAVKETGDVELADGQRVENLLVVNKDRIYMESVGAVKELCRVTDNLNTRINELEVRRQHRSRGHRTSSSNRTNKSQTSLEPRSVSMVNTAPGASKSQTQREGTTSDCAGNPTLGMSVEMSTTSIEFEPRLSGFVSRVMPWLIVLFTVAAIALVAAFAYMRYEETISTEAPIGSNVTSTLSPVTGHASSYMNTA